MTLCAESAGGALREMDALSRLQPLVYFYTGNARATPQDKQKRSSSSSSPTGGLLHGISMYNGKLRPSRLARLHARQSGDALVANSLSSYSM